MGIVLNTVRNITNRVGNKIAPMRKTDVIKDPEAFFARMTNPSSAQSFRFQNAVNGLSSDELMNVLENIEKRHRSLKKNIFSLFGKKESPESAMVNFTILYKTDKNAFDYIMNSSNDEMFRHFTRDAWTKNIPNLSLGAVKEIEKGLGEGHHFFEYVTNSDAFNRSRESVINLNQYLSNKVVSNNFTAYRGERNTGMFDAVVLDSDFAGKVRELASKSEKSKNAMIFPQTGRYLNTSNEAVSLYDYIKNKKQLTLSDAMQTAILGDKEYVENIISRIKDSKITDNRFKSLSLNKDFVNDWISRECDCGNILSTAVIKNKINIKAGNQCQYVDAPRSEQMEFILNNNNKSFKFNNVKYEPSKNQFIVESDVSCI